jgi:plasmid stability protein
MATLHVRNVPDDLYERLRAAAEADGRSIGGQAIALIGRGLRVREEERRNLEQALESGSPFKRRFARSAKELVVRAQQLAQQDGASETKPAHVLLAMLEDDVLRPALERGGVTDESVQAALPPPARPRETPPPVSAEARQMLEQALLSTLG